MSYGSGQRLAFAGLVIGFLMCATGAIAPFWQQGSISINEIIKITGESIPFIGDTKLATVYGGLWWYCFSTFLGEKQCRPYNLDSDDPAQTWVIRIACVVNVFLTLACALTALCRTCCCGGGKTVFHGIIAFLAGAAGLTVVGVFASTVEDGFAMKLNLVQYGWAFFIYIAGSAIVVLVSFLLCFASPNNPLTPMIISTVNHVLPNGRYTRMTDERVLIEQPGRETQLAYPQVQSY
ncbi:unnamed protein product [Candidula unifasciata]|uniref:Claudin n=1 Tax=Candidula unifasciata TaxID=100452 RepID=A0A8S3ZBM2_9EUPU|nr:unnamed protein product [Candidula unifasciata]